MPLLNYTTTIPADKTAAEIVRILAGSGARQVLTDYEAGRPTGVAFALNTSTGLRRYQLPVNAAAVEKVLREQRVGHGLATPAQAERVAWRILKDWVEAQVAIIATQMVAVDQVFLPYMLVPGGTVYDLYLAEQLAIGPGTDLS